MPLEGFLENLDDIFENVDLTRDKESNYINTTLGKNIEFKEYVIIKNNNKEMLKKHPYKRR
jgi:hypothetical protein